MPCRTALGHGGPQGDGDLRGAGPGIGRCVDRTAGAVAPVAGLGAAFGPFATGERAKTCEVRADLAHQAVRPRPGRTAPSAPADHPTGRASCTIDLMLRSPT
jgi:hypothetical protein